MNQSNEDNTAIVFDTYIITGIVDCDDVVWDDYIRLFYSYWCWWWWLFLVLAWWRCHWYWICFCFCLKQTQIDQSGVVYNPKMIRKCCKNATFTTVFGVYTVHFRSVLYRNIGHRDKYPYCERTVFDCFHILYRYNTASRFVYLSRMLITINLPKLEVLIASLFFDSNSYFFIIEKNKIYFD